jgi:hypothetical protein
MFVQHGWVQHSLHDTIAGVPSAAAAAACLSHAMPCTMSALHMLAVCDSGGTMHLRRSTCAADLASPAALTYTALPMHYPVSRTCRVRYTPYTAVYTEAVTCTALNHMHSTAHSDSDNHSTAVLLRLQRSNTHK